MAARPCITGHRGAGVSGSGLTPPLNEQNWHFHPGVKATGRAPARYHCVRQPEIERIYVMFNLEDHDFDRWRVRYSTEFLWEKNCTGGQGRAPTGAPPLPLPRPRWERIP